MEGYRIIKGREPGPIVAIVASLHGDEPAGMAAYAFLKRHFIDEENELSFGEIRLIKGNIEARKAGVRYFEYDLNRMFLENYDDGVDQDCYEFKRVQEIKKMVEGADYIIDLHSMTSDGEPFAIMADSEKTYPECGELPKEEGIVVVTAPYALLRGRHDDNKVFHFWSSIFSLLINRNKFIRKNRIKGSVAFFRVAVAVMVSNSFSLK